MVLAALGVMLWSGHAVRLVECAIDRTVCALNDALCLLCFLLLEVDFVDKLGTVELSAVAVDMI
jgi:hypothetical protein